MFNRKSIYALNKKDPNAIVYTDADGNLIRLTAMTLPVQLSSSIGKTGRTAI